MPAHSPPSPDPLPPNNNKRPRQVSPERDTDSPTSGPSAGLGLASPTAAEPSLHEGAGGQASKVGQSSNFRNVSACNRCRLRKNRCDQRLPSCASCEKAKVACVGYDPITKKEIPRSYVFYLETRVGQLEALLRANNVQFPPAEDLEHCSRPGAEGGLDTPNDGSNPVSSDAVDRTGPSRTHNNGDERAKHSSSARHGGTSGNRHQGSTNGISFARVVFAAVQSSVGDHRSSSEKAGIRPYKPIAGNGAVAAGTSMRDSFFGLHTRPTINPAEFPDKDVALNLITLYFEHANPQIPVLHRVEFMRMFELAYADEGRIRGPKELYMLNMVFAIGGGIIMDNQSGSSRAPASKDIPKQAQPEQYHASAIVHLEACLSNSGGGLEELQAVLLLAKFALLRPVPPGLWYIVGVAVRLAIDLGLYLEDGKEVANAVQEIDSELAPVDLNSQEARSKLKGRREYNRDRRRRLWWCTYSLDRLVSTCVGRPFGVSDQVVTTEFPSLLEDKYITASGFTRPVYDNEPTYKVIAYHYFRLRLLQSEILQVLQYQQTQLARASGQNSRNIYMHTRLPSPFLNQFDSFRSWRKDIDRRLYEWRNSSPSQAESGVLFSSEFLDLNYWQAIIMLYRQSLEVPEIFEGEYHTSKEVNSPSLYPPEAGGDEERVYLKVAEAGQKIIRIYRQLHLVGLVNYTYLATHHLFMAGVSYLYAIWHSPVVRSRLSMDEVDFTVLAATSVFTDLIDKCPPAEACRDAFDRTAKATVKMANQTGGFGPAAMRQKHTSKGGHDYFSARDATANRHRQHQHRVSLDQTVQRPAMQSQFDIPTSDGYSSNRQTPQVPPIQTNQFQPSMPNVKMEHDGYSMLRTLPQTTSANSDAGITPDNSAIDPILLPSPSAAGQGQSPMSVNTVQGGGLNHLSSPSDAFNTPGGHFNYSDLQGMDFLQGLQTGSSVDGEMDLGFGLGWEGGHHDISDGQQVDLFDGFFFGQQGGGNNNMGGI